jgi:hypothetical protein
MYRFFNFLYIRHDICIKYLFKFICLNFQLFCKLISLHFVLTYVEIFTTYLESICSSSQTRTDTSPGIHHIKLGPCYLHHRAICLFPRKANLSPYVEIRSQCTAGYDPLVSGMYFYSLARILLRLLCSCRWT